MSFAAPKTDLPDLSSGNERQSSWEEGEPLARVLGRGRLALDWKICQPTEPRLTQVGKTHEHYHLDIAGLLCHGVIYHLDGLYIGGKRYHTFNYTRGPSELFTTFTVDTDLGHTDQQTTIHFYWGTDDQVASPVLDAFHPGESHPGYRGQAYAVIENLYAGEFSPTVPNVEFTFLASAPFTHSATEYGTAGVGEGINPMNALLDIFCNPRAGLGMDQDEIFDMDYIVSKRAEIITEATARYGVAGAAYVSPQITRRRKASQWVGELLSYLDGFCRVKSGKIYPDFFPRSEPVDTSPSRYTELNEHDFTEDPDFEYSSLDNALSAVAVKFHNVERDSKETSVVVNSPHMRRVLGETRIKEQDRLWSFYEYQAKIFGQRFLLETNQDLVEGRIKVRKPRATHPDNVNVPAELRGKPIREGELFRVSYGANGLLAWARCIRRKQQGQKVELHFLQERGTFPDAYLPLADPVPDLVDYTADDIANFRAVECPAGLALLDSRALTQTYLLPLVERPGKQAVSFDLSYADDGTWTGDEAIFSTLTGWAARGTLGGALSSSSAEATFNATFTGVDAATILQNQTLDDAADNALLLFVENEVLSIKTATPTGTPNQFSIVALRARVGTEAVAHSGSTECWVIPRERLTYLSAQRFREVYDGSGDYDSAQATVYYTVRNRNFYENESDWATPKQVTFLDRSTVTGLTATGYLESVQFKWDIKGPEFSYYLIRVDDNPSFTSPETYRTSANKFSVPFTAGETAYAQVQSVDQTGRVGPWSATASAEALAGGSGAPGLDALNSYLTNENHSVPSAADGSSPLLSGAGTDMVIYRGTSEDTGNWSFSKVDTNCTSNLAGNTVNVTAMTADTAYVDITATRSGFPDQVKRFTLSKAKQGLPGDDGTSPVLVDVTGTSNTFHTSGGSTTPATITLSVAVQNLASPSYQWQYLSGTWTNIASETSATYDVGSGDFTGQRTFRCLVDGVHFDTFTITHTADGLSPRKLTASGDFPALTSSFQGGPSFTIPADGAGDWYLDIFASAGGGGTGAMTLDIELRVGATVIASDTDSGSDTSLDVEIDYNGEYTFSGSEVVRVFARISANSGGGGATMEADEIL